MEKGSKIQNQLIRENKWGKWSEKWRVAPQIFNLVYRISSGNVLDIGLISTNINHISQFAQQIFTVSQFFSIAFHSNSGSLLHSSQFPIFHFHSFSQYFWPISQLTVALSPPGMNAIWLFHNNLHKINIVCRYKFVLFAYYHYL